MAVYKISTSNMVKNKPKWKHFKNWYLLTLSHESLVVIMSKKEGLAEMVALRYNQGKRLIPQGDVSMARYVKAAKAIELSGLPVSTFHRWAREGKITKYYPTNESGRAMYDADEMKALREQMNPDSEEEQKEEFETDWLTTADLGNLYSLEYEKYGEDTGDPRFVRRWIQRNPYIGRIIYEKSERRDLWGALIFLPIVDETIMTDLVSHKIRDIELNPEGHIKTFDESGIYDLYAASVIMRDDKVHLLSNLMRSYFDWWVEQYPRIKIGKIWGRVVSDEGELLAIRLQASPIDWLPGKVYRLDLSVPRRLPLIRNFQQSLAAKEKA
jgi:hypothetical protein